MIKAISFSGAMCFGVFISSGLAVGDEPSLAFKEEQAFKQAVAFVEPSVVRIQTVGGLDRVGQVLTGTGPTTGVVVSPDGFIISSAFNFASKPASILVELPDGRRFPANEVATDRLRMLTLLKIEANQLKPAVAADADSVRVGQWGIAVGRTYDPQTPNISVGIISAKNRIWGKALQTDAKVSPVNYGGPLVNVEGKVLGILVPLSLKPGEVTAGVEWYDSGIGFAIPMQAVMSILPRLKEGKDLRAGLMGISFRRNDLTVGDLVVDMVRPDSPAYRAGMRPKDVLLKVDGQELHRVGDLRYALGTRYEGDTIEVEFRRDKETMQREMTLVGELIPYEAGFLGILPERHATRDESAKLAVRLVYTDSPAAEAGLKPHDVIVSFQNQPVATANELWELLSRERPGNKVSLTYRRGNAEKEVKLALGSPSQEIPFDLTDSFIPPPENKEEAHKGLKVGLVQGELAAHNHSYWAYVPDDYNPAYGYSLVVWLHPGGDTMEASIARDWQTVCETYGIILLAPKAEKISGWDLNEAEFVHDAVEEIRGKYNIDPARICLHGYGSSSPFAFNLAFKYRDLFKGIAVIGGVLRQPPPDNSPEFRQQLLLICGTKDKSFQLAKRTATGLQKMKYPVTFIKIEGRDDRYPPAEEVRDIAIWVDTLDRL